MEIEKEFIQDYVNTDADLYWLCQRYRKRELTEALDLLLCLRESLAVTGNLEMAAQRAQLLINQLVCDQNVNILIRALYAHVVYSLKKSEDAKIIIKSSQSFLNDEILPEVFAYFEWIRLTIFINDSPLYKKTFHEMLATLPLQHKRMNHFLLIDLYRRNLEQIDEEDMSALYDRAFSDEFKRTLNTNIFINYLEGGRLTEALGAYQTFSNQKYYFIEDKGINNNLEKYALLLDFWLKLSVSSNQTNNIPPGYLNNSFYRSGTQSYPTWLLTLKALKEKRSEEAMYWARLDEKSLNRHRVPFIFRLNALRAELSNKNIEQAEDILQRMDPERQSAGIINLFYARLYFLKEQIEQVSVHLRRLKTHVEKNKQQGRLNFELILSNELSATDFFQLGGLFHFSAEESYVPIASKPQATTMVSKKVDHKGLDRIIGQSKAVVLLKENIKKCANHDMTVLITGETGTGKELIAECIHEVSSRNKEPLLKINCAAVSESLLESELFGHVKGAFTGAHSDRKGLFEEAGKGTIFLDEIGEISPKIQTALLRVLESNEIKPIGSNFPKKVFCRMITATNRNLKLLSQQNKFRQDLYYRLHRLPIQSPALRERAEDIWLLVQHFALIACKGMPIPNFSEDLRQSLMHYSWPGNIRELKNEVERMVIMNAEKRNLTREDLEINIRYHQPESPLQITIKPGQYPLNTESAIVIPAEAEKVNSSFTSSLRRIEFIKELFQQKIKLTRKEVALACGCSTFTTTRDLKQLIAEGFICKVEPNNAPRTHYFEYSP